MKGKWLFPKRSGSISGDAECATVPLPPPPPPQHHTLCRALQAAEDLNNGTMGDWNVQCGSQYKFDRCIAHTVLTVLHNPIQCHTIRGGRGRQPETLNTVAVYSLYSLYHIMYNKSVTSLRIDIHPFHAHYLPIKAIPHPPAIPPFELIRILLTAILIDLGFLVTC